MKAIFAEDRMPESEAVEKALTRRIQLTDAAKPASTTFRVYQIGTSE
jgi:hypothetical protein